MLVVVLLLVVDRVHLVVRMAVKHLVHSFVDITDVIMVADPHVHHLVVVFVL